MGGACEIQHEIVIAYHVGDSVGFFIYFSALLFSNIGSMASKKSRLWNVDSCSAWNSRFTDHIQHGAFMYAIAA